MQFATAMKEETKWTKTENGAVVKNTTDSALLDMFATIGAMRSRSEDEIIKKFELAYQEDPLGAMRCLYYARDVRGGLGERRTFRILINYAAKKHADEVRRNLSLIPFYGRWDDMYSLIDTPLEEDMWEIVRRQLEADRTAMGKNHPCSLLAKWLKKADATSKNTSRMGAYTANNLGYSVRDYNRICSSLRKYLDVVEVKMCARDWANIEYPSVPSRAMMNYRNAFKKHDNERFEGYLKDVTSGAAKINASTLYPYDIVEKILYQEVDSDVLAAQWNSLPNYVTPGTNAVVMADVSGSMTGRPMATSVGLALYFAERNHGPYHNLFMTFTTDPQFVEIKGADIRHKISFISRASWHGSTNLEAAMLKILSVAKENHCSQDEMPEALIIISDMEINSCTYQLHGDNFYDYVKKEFDAAGYKIPNIVFWNVDSRHDTFLADAHHKGVQLVSGQSASTFKNLVGSIGKTPVELMYDVLNSDRYQSIIVV